MSKRIETLEELDALPAGSVVIDNRGEAFQRDLPPRVPDRWYSVRGARVPSELLFQRYRRPLTLVYVPYEEAEEPRESAVNIIARHDICTSVMFASLPDHDFNAETLDQIMDEILRTINDLAPSSKLVEFAIRELGGQN